MNAKRFDAPVTSALSRAQRIEVVTRAFPHVKLDNKSEDYVEGAYDAAIREIERRNEAAQIREERADLAALNTACHAPRFQKSVLDEAEERVAKEREQASKAGPPPGAVVRKN